MTPILNLYVSKILWAQDKPMLKRLHKTTQTCWKSAINLTWPDLMSMKEQWGRVYCNTAMLVPGVSGKSSYNRSKAHKKRDKKAPLRERQCLANGRESTARQQRCWWLRPNTCIIDPHLHPPPHHHHVHQLGWKEAKQSTQYSQFKQTALLGAEKDLIPIIMFDWEKAGRWVDRGR